MAFIDKITNACCGSRDLTWLLVGNVLAAIALWVLMLLFKLFGISNDILYSLLALPADAMPFATHPWTLLSYMFVHFSPLHLIFNMLWLFWFGRMLADIERPGTIFRLYLGGGATGGIFYLVMAALTGYSPGAFLAGSSAAVLAIMCATGLRMPSRTLNLFIFGEVKLKWIALACILITLLGGSGIAAQSAHLGGAFFGVAWFLIRRRMRAPRSGKRPARVPRSAIKAMRGAVPDESRLDQLLDKIRVSGYDSLTAREKNELNHISARISK